VLGLPGYGKLRLYQLMAAVHAKQEYDYNQLKESWEQTRVLASASVNFSMAKQNDKKQFLKQLRFPWDTEKAGEWTEEKKRELKELSDKLHGNKIDPNGRTK